MRWPRGMTRCLLRVATLGSTRSSRSSWPWCWMTGDRAPALSLARSWQQRVWVRSLNWCRRRCPTGTVSSPMPSSTPSALAPAWSSSVSWRGYGCGDDDRVADDACGHVGGRNIVAALRDQIFQRGHALPPRPCGVTTVRLALGLRSVHLTSPRLLSRPMESGVRAVEFTKMRKQMRLHLGRTT
jgi:hypothetical protein